jgi:hypothetical protein
LSENCLPLIFHFFIDPFYCLFSFHFPLCIPFRRVVCGSAHGNRQHRPGDLMHSFFLSL